MIGDEVEKRKGMDLTKTGQVGFLGGNLEQNWGFVKLIIGILKRIGEDCRLLVLLSVTFVARYAGYGGVCFCEST